MGADGIEDISDTIGAIYDCALDPARWPDTLEATCARMEFRTASLVLQELPSGRPLLDYSIGIAPEDLARMPGLGPHVVEACGGPARFMALPLDEPLLLSRVNPDASSDKPFIAWGLEQGLTDILTLALGRGPDGVSSVGFGRHRDAGPAGERELGLARLLAPHMKRAILISRLLEARTVATATHESVLDGLSVAVLLLGPELRLVHANRGGRGAAPERRSLGAAPRARDGARGRDPCAGGGDGGPARRDRPARARRARAAGRRRGADPPCPAAGRGAAGAQGPGGGLRGPGDDAAPGPARGHRGAVRPDARRGPRARLAAAGTDNAGIARALGVGLSTVRTHVQKLFDKTGAHRRAELAALVAGFTLRSTEREIRASPPFG